MNTKYKILTPGTPHSHTYAIGSAVRILVCITIFIPCNLYNWQEWFFDVHKILWVSVRKLPFLFLITVFNSVLPMGKTGVSCEHTNTQSISKELYIQGHSGLPSKRPQLRGRKRNTPLHNTSRPEPLNLTLATSSTMPLVRAYHHISKLHYAIRPIRPISAPRARWMCIVGP